MTDVLSTTLLGAALVHDVLTVLHAFNILIWKNGFQTVLSAKLKLEILYSGGCHSVTDLNEVGYLLYVLKFLLLMKRELQTLLHIVTGDLCKNTNQITPFFWKSFSTSQCPEKWFFTAGGRGGHTTKCFESLVKALYLLCRKKCTHTQCLPCISRVSGSLKSFYIHGPWVKILC